MKLIRHPQGFAWGTRVLMLKGRHKDGRHEQRCVLRVTHDADQFYKTLNDLSAIALDGERIYGTPSARSLERASRILKERMLENDYCGADQMEFYRRLEARWVSCLCQRSAAHETFWMLDVDTPEDEARCAEISEVYARVRPEDGRYAYESKSGRHVLLKPFDRNLVSEDARRVIQTDPLILWGY